MQQKLWVLPALGLITLLGLATVVPALAEDPVLANGGRAVLAIEGMT